MIADTQSQARIEAKKKNSSDNAEKLAAKRQKEQMELNKMFAAHEAGRKARKEKAKNTDALIKMLAAWSTDALKDAASGTESGKKMADDVVNALVKGGMKKSDAKAKLEETLSVVRSEKKTQNPIIKRAATDEALKGVVGTKSVEKPDGSSNNVWILCVDASNGRKLPPVFQFKQILRNLKNAPSSRKHT